MEDLYEQFIREKQYLLSVSPCTVAAYRWAWKAMAPALHDHPRVTKPEVLARVAELRSRGLSEVTVNTYLRSVNAFCRWAFQEGHFPTLVKFPRLKEDQRVLEAFSSAQVDEQRHFRAKRAAAALTPDIARREPRGQPRPGGTNDELRTAEGRPIRIGCRFDLRAWSHAVSMVCLLW